MSIPCLYFSKYCCQGGERIAGKVSKKDSLIGGLIAFDAVTAITSLVVGILSACSMITMAPALTVSLVCLSAVIVALWIAMAIKK